MAPKRYAVVGTGGRGRGMFVKPLIEDFPGAAELVALCDVNPVRMAAVAEEFAPDVPQFTDFDEMMQQVDPDAVVASSKDCTAHTVVLAMSSR